MYSWVQPGCPYGAPQRALCAATAAPSSDPNTGHAYRGLCGLTASALARYIEVRSRSSRQARCQPLCGLASTAQVGLVLPRPARLANQPASRKGRVIGRRGVNVPPTSHPGGTRMHAHACARVTLCTNACRAVRACGPCICAWHRWRTLALQEGCARPHNTHHTTVWL